jgi:hypothetical protein
MSLVALSAGWMLGKVMMGPSRVAHSQPAVSVHSANEDKSVADARSNDSDSNGNDKNGAKAAASDLEAKAADAQESESASQDQNALQGAGVKDEKGNRGRKAAYSNPSRREFVSTNVRRGPGIGVVTRPIKAVFKPLKRANPLRLRIW